MLFICTECAVTGWQRMLMTVYIFVAHSCGLGLYMYVKCK